MSAKVITIANQKGGVAKTTTTASMGYELSQRGYKVLLIDMDAQGDLTYYFNSASDEGKTMYDVLCKNAEMTEVIIPISDNLSIAPSDILLAGAEQELSRTGKEYTLKEKLEAVRNEYDYIIIDTAPALGILTVNAFTVTDEVIIPSNAGIFSAKAFIQLSKTIDTVKKYLNHKIVISGILITRYNPHTNIAKAVKQTAESIGENINTKVYNTFIRNACAVEEAQYNQTVIQDYNKNSNVSQDYRSFVDEYLS